MSLQIQNGDRVRSCVAAQSERAATEHPTWGRCAPIGRSRSTPLESPIGLSRSRVLVSVSSLCVALCAAEGPGRAERRGGSVLQNGRRFQQITRPLASKYCMDFFGDSLSTTGYNLGSFGSCMQAESPSPSRGFQQQSGRSDAVRLGTAAVSRGRSRSG